MECEYVGILTPQTVLVHEARGLVKVLVLLGVHAIRQERPHLVVVLVLEPKTQCPGRYIEVLQDVGFVTYGHGLAPDPQVEHHGFVCWHVTYRPDTVGPYLAIGAGPCLLATRSTCWTCLPLRIL